MNPIDERELLSNVSTARREAKLLLAESTVAAQSAGLRRIIGILGYMREHLEMLTASRWHDEPDVEQLSNDGKPQPSRAPRNPADRSR